jgi:hypothetical protein
MRLKAEGKEVDNGHNALCEIRGYYGCKYEYCCVPACDAVSFGKKFTLCCTLKIETVLSSETSGFFYQPTRRLIPSHSNPLRSSLI